MQGLLNLGKCQCVDFAGQITAISLCMIQHTGYSKALWIVRDHWRPVRRTHRRNRGTYSHPENLGTHSRGHQRHCWVHLMRTVWINWKRNKQQSQNQSSEDGFWPARSRRGGLNHLRNLSKIIHLLFLHNLYKMRLLVWVVSERGRSFPFRGLRPVAGRPFFLYGQHGSTYQLLCQFR